MKKNLKKLTSIVLILIMLLLPFSNLLNVKAAEVTIATDDTKTLASDKNFEYVTNTTNLYLNGVYNYDEDESKNDVFYAYKILDTYYDKNSNQITYDFTTSFKAFLAQLPEDDSFKDLDISGYQELTGDDPNDGSAKPTITTTSTLNKLVSKYAAFIKKQSSDSVTRIQLVEGNESTQRMAKNIEVGSYLVLATTSAFSHKTYGVMVGNAMLNGTSGTWQLEECTIVAKSSKNVIAGMLLNDDLSNFDDGIALDLTYSTSKSLYFGGYITVTNLTLPTNTNASITNNQQAISLLKTTEVSFPSGIVVNMNKIFFVNGSEKTTSLEVEDNSIYFSHDENRYKYADFTYTTDSTGTKVTIYNIDKHGILNDEILLFELEIDDNIKLGMDTSSTNSAGNKIVTTGNYLKDPYVDIGTNPTDADIRKAVGTITNENTIYTNGVKVTNKADDTALNGAEFQMCSDKDCTVKVGKSFTITENGTYTFKGLNDTDTYYIKQVKAPTGYRLLTDAIELEPSKLDKQTGLYSIEITNTKMGLLPSTGGLGTILYTTFGLLIIIVGSIAYVSYRKKAQVNG